MLSSSHYLQMFSTFALNFLVCSVAVYLFSKLALSRNVLLDSPSTRKQHLGSVPLVGGIAIFLAFSISVLVFNLWPVAEAVYVAAIWLVLIGLIDDLIDLSSRFRFAVQICAALILVYFGDMRIETVGQILGSPTQLGGFSVLFTVLCTLGVINAINMIDGVDGLSGGITLLTLAALLFIATGAVHVSVLMLMLSLAGGLCAFFLFNTGYYGPARKVFMGDAGSTFIGAVLAWLFITLSQNGMQPLSPVVAGWLFGLPLIDSVSVMVRRLLKGQSPFQADRNHLHHQLIDSGLSMRQTLLVMLTIHSIMVIVGLLANGQVNVEPYLFWTFAALVVLRHFVFSFIPMIYRANRT